MKQFEAIRPTITRTLFFLSIIISIVLSIMISHPLFSSQSFLHNQPYPQDNSPNRNHPHHNQQQAYHTLKLFKQNQYLQNHLFSGPGHISRLCYHAKSMTKYGLFALAIGTTITTLSHIALGTTTCTSENDIQKNNRSLQSRTSMLLRKADSLLGDNLLVDNSPERSTFGQDKQIDMFDQNNSTIKRDLLILSISTVASYFMLRYLFLSPEKKYKNILTHFVAHWPTHRPHVPEEFITYFDEVYEWFLHCGLENWPLDEKVAEGVLLLFKKNIT